MLNQQRVLARVFSMLMLLQCTIFQSLLADEGKSEKEEYIRGIFASAIRDSLMSVAQKPNFDGASSDQIEVVAKTALFLKHAELKGKPLYANDTIVDQAEKRFVDLINTNKTNLYIEHSSTKEAVQICLMKLLDETTMIAEEEKTKSAKLFQTHLLSDYRFLLGGSWTHSEEEGPTKGIFTAELFLRTRWLDGRRGNPVHIDAVHDTIEYLTDIPREHLFDKKGPYKEGSFLDLLVDAQFVTNQPFNDTTLDSAGATSGQFFLRSVTSSNLSVALFWSPWGPVFFDWGAFGPFARFEISTREKVADVFRRVIVGIRVENRAPLILYGSSVEVGFCRNRIAGSLDQDKELFGLNRIMLNMELPLTSNENRLGLYAQFHGEWPLGSVENSETTTKSGIKYRGLDSPPIYQFRFGATFDPIKLFGPLFGIRE